MRISKHTLLQKLHVLAQLLARVKSSPRKIEVDMPLSIEPFVV